MEWVTAAYVLAFAAALLIGAVPMAMLFVWRQIALEQAGKTWLLSVNLMRSIRSMSGVMMVLLHFSAIPGLFLVLAVYLQTGFGLDPWHSGMATAPFPLGVMLGSTMTRRFGTRWIALRMGAGAGVLFFAHLHGPQQAEDYPAAMQFALFYPLGIFAVILVILMIRSRLLARRQVAVPDA